MNNTEENNIDKNQEKYVKSNRFAMMGFGFSIISMIINPWGIISLIGLILSIIGIIWANKQNEKNGMGIAVVGVVLGAIGVIGTIWQIMLLL